MSYYGGPSKDRHIIHKFECLDDFLVYATRTTDKDGASRELGYGFDGDFKIGDKKLYWQGTRTWGEAKELLANGWHDARPQVDAVLDPLREALMDRLDTVIDRQHDLIGSEVDIDAFCNGEMDCMYDDIFVEEPKNGRVFTLLVSGAVNSGVSAEMLFKRGVAITALVEAFQMVGAELEVWTEESFYRNGTTVSFVTRLHRAGENLDVDAIMFPLAHPAWFRRFSFAAAEQQTSEVRDHVGFRPGHGYGQAVDLRCVEVVNPSFTLTKGGSSPDTRELDADPLAYILKTLKAQGAYGEAAADEAWN